MKIKKAHIKKHLFICCHARSDGRECCESKNASILLKGLKSRLKENKLFDIIKVSKSGCLGSCESGISAILYPEGTHITELTPDDENELYEMLTFK